MKDVRKSLLLALAACWALLALGWMQRKLVGRMDEAGAFVGGWPDRLKLAGAPRETREAMLTGDEALGKFLAAAKANIGGAKKVYVLAFDPTRNDLFQWYRCAFELFPARVWYAPGPELPPGRKEIRLAVGPDFANVIAANGIDRIAYFHKPDPAKSMWFAASVTPKPELVLKPLTSPEPAPAPPVPSRMKWWLGWLLLLPLGFALSSAAGLDAAFKDRIPARVALAWLLGVGGTAWLMQMLSLVGVRWSLPAIMGAWVPIIAVGGMKIWKQRADSSTAVDSMLSGSLLQSVSAPSYLRPLGISLLSVAGLIALVEAHIPVSAWGNWDAWAIWALKAKACWEAMGIPFPYLKESQYVFAHPDYPNGLPSVQCFIGMIAGGLDETLLRLVPLGHFLALLALLPVVLRDLGAGPWALPLAGALALLPKLQEYGTLGYGDLPVAAWGVAGLAVLVRVHAGRAAAWTVALVGGLSTQVKDEGLIWAAGCLIAVGAWTLTSRVSRKQAFIAGGVLLALVLPWKLTLKSLGIGPNDYVINPGAMLNVMPERLPIVIRGYALEMWGGGATMLGVTGRPDPQADVLNHLLATFNVLWYAIPLFLALGWRRLIASPHRELLLPLAVQVSGYLAVYFASNRDIPFHVVTTSDRVLTQLSCVTFLIAASAAFSAPAASAPEPAPRSKFSPKPKR